MIVSAYVLLVVDPSFVRDQRGIRVITLKCCHFELGWNMTNYIAYYVTLNTLLNNHKKFHQNRSAVFS
jgi:hypothetical protein